MFIVVTGGYRTGSTLAYNIAAEFAEHCGGKRRSGFPPLEFSPIEALAKMVEEAEGSVHVWKSHTYRPRFVFPGVEVIHTTRCPFATAASNQRIKEFTQPRRVNIVQEIRWQQAENPPMSAMPHCLTLEYADAVPDPTSWVSAVFEPGRVKMSRQ